jgi:hypothetical protein
MRGHVSIALAALVLAPFATARGGSEFECTGVRQLNGYPFILSFAEIN